MKFYSYILIGLSLISICTSEIQAQVEKNTADGLYYTREKSYGIVFHTGGWGINYRYINNKGAFKKQFFGGEIVSLRHLKEVKVKNASYANSKGFVYGKLYNVWIIRPEYGLQKILYGKEIKSALQISRILSFGPSLFFAKPVYLEIIKKSQDYTDDIVSERYDPQKHQASQIYGKSNFSTGLNKSTLLPGAFIKWAYQFDFAPADDRLKSIELGTVLDIQPFGLQQMAYNPKKYVFFNFYVAYSFGKKFFK